MIIGSGGALPPMQCCNGIRLLSPGCRFKSCPPPLILAILATALRKRRRSRFGRRFAAIGRCASPQPDTHFLYIYKEAQFAPSKGYASNAGRCRIAVAETVVPPRPRKQTKLAILNLFARLGEHRIFFIVVAAEGMLKPATTATRLRDALCRLRRFRSQRKGEVRAVRVLYVTPEVSPLAKAGGLADVSAALPVSLRDQGVDIQLLMPGYPAAMDRASNLRLATVVDNPVGVGQVRIWKGTVPTGLVPVWLVECPSLFARDGNPYGDEQRRDFPDNALRFGLLSYIGAMIGTHAIGLSWRPELVHVNDWHTALLPTMLRLRPGPYPPTVLAIHNLAHQGVFQPEVTRRLSLRIGARVLASVKGEKQVSFLQIGIQSADRIVTVSPTYAAEIQTPEYGYGLDDLLRHLPVPIRGILNGVDYSSWNPACDPYLAVNYDPASLSNKRACKSAIQEELRLDVEASVPLVAFMSRLAWQKMPEIVLEILPALLAEGIQLGLVAEGDRAYETSFRELAATYPGRVGVRIGYDEALAHRLVAGADMMLNPARYEPCGLTAVYAMRYGTPPIARRTGGLIDTVVDVQPQSLVDGSATGFLFDAPNAEETLSCMQRALQLFRQQSTWRRVQIAGMRRDFSWTRSAREYAELYQQISGNSRWPASGPGMRHVWSRDRGWTTLHLVPEGGEEAHSREDDMGIDRAELIRRRAYQIWEHQGRPNGRDVEHWLQAEAELTEPQPAPKAKSSRSGGDKTKSATGRGRTHKATRARRSAGG